MAVGRQLNTKGQMRVDVPHLRLIESGVVYDFDALAGSMLAGKAPYIINGFALGTYTVGAYANTLQLITANGVVVNYGASENGSILSVPSNRANEVLGVGNSRLRGGFTPSATNYIGIDFIRTEDSGTSDIVQFLDTTTLKETPKTIPLGRTLDYVIVISTTPFNSTPNLCPIAIVVTNANNQISTVTDARPMYFRLAKGGQSPNPLGVYDWPQGRSPENSSIFTGGDKAIGDEKTWKSAIMQRLWEITGGEYWYSNVTDRNLKFLGDPGNLHTRAGLTNNVIWDGTTLSWSGLYVLLDNSTGTTNQIADNTAGTAFADGDIAYIELDRFQNHSGGTALTVTKVTSAQYNTLPMPTRPGSRYILFWVKLMGATLRAYSRLDYLSIGQYSGAATATTYGVVKTNSPNAVSGGPFAVIADAAGGGYAIAAGISRGTGAAGITAGPLYIGNQIGDTSVQIASASTVTNIMGGASVAGTLGVTGTLTASGALTVLGTFHSMSTTPAVVNSALSVAGALTAGASGVESVLTGTTTIAAYGAAGTNSLLQFSGSSTTAITSVTTGGILAPTSNDTTLVLLGNKSASSTTGPEVLVSSNVVRLSGSVFKINNTSSYPLIDVDYVGAVRNRGTRSTDQTYGSTDAMFTSKNAIRAWAKMRCDAAGAVTIVDGFNISSASWAGGDLTVVLANAVPSVNCIPMVCWGATTGPLGSLSAIMGTTSSVVIRYNAAATWADQMYVNLTVIG